MPLGNLTDYLVHIFEAPPGERSEKDIWTILPIVVMKTSCLKSLDKETVAFIFQKSQRMQFKENDIIVKQGEIGDTFYIILHGSVSIYLDPKQDEKVETAGKRSAYSSAQQPTLPQDQDQNGDNNTASESRKVADDQKSERIHSAKRTQSGHARVARRHLPAVRRQKHVLDKDRERKKLGVVVNKLGRYQSFGELALLYPNNKRNASAIADEPTDLLAISFDVFKSTLQESLERDLNEKRLFIQTHPFFSKWPLPQQRQLQWSLRRTTHKLGSTVIKQGEVVNGLHFLVSTERSHELIKIFVETMKFALCTGAHLGYPGETTDLERHKMQELKLDRSGRARLSAEPLKHRHQFSEVFAQQHHNQGRQSGQGLERQDSSLSEIVDEMRSTKGCYFPSIDPLTYIRRTDGYAAAEKIIFEKHVDLCLIEEGEVISDCELLLGIDKNIFTVTACSACTFYHLERKVFDRLILRKVPHTLTMMKMLAETKLSSRLASTQGKRIPILSPLLLGILNVHIIDPLSSEHKQHGAHKTLFTPRLDVTVHSPAEPKMDKSNAVLIKWFIHGKTPTMLQPLMKDAIYQRERMHVRAQQRAVERKRSSKAKQQTKSLTRRVKESFITNLKESVKAANTMKKLSLQRSVLTPVSRWK